MDTTTLADQVTRPDWRDATPTVEPDDNKRATVKMWRRELAEWMRAHGIAASGDAWESATVGERDLSTLRRIAADDPAGAGLVRHWSGYVTPSALADGDATPYGVVVGAPVTDPETGRVWVVARRVKPGATDHDTPTMVATTADVELDPAAPVEVTRGRGNLSTRVAA